MFKKSFEQWPKVFKRAFPWVLINLFIQIFLTLSQQMIPQKETTMMIFWIILVFGVSLFFSVIGIIVINQATYDIEHGQNTPFQKSLGIYFKPVMIESMRAFLPIILKFCLFIIPGIVESIRLYWITYVVQFDDRYKTGQIDALVESRNVTKGRFWKSAFILIFVSGLSMLPHLGTSSTESIKDSFWLTFLLFISVGLEVYGDILLYHFYWNVKGEQKDVTKI